MKILLLGEYSRLHNTLKEGLISLGHDVKIVSDGDGFKNFPTDISIKPSLVQAPAFKWIASVFYKIFKFDLGKLERGIRCYFHAEQLRNYEVVQLINEKPIKTIPRLERYLLKRLFKENSKVFLLSCGIDLISLEFLLQKGFRYSLMDPFIANPDLKNDYQYIYDYKRKSHRKTHNLVFKNIGGVIATDFDYVLPLLNNRQFLGLIQNPVNVDTIAFKPLEIKNRVVIFLGINKSTYHKKGIPYFEKALEIVEKNYSEKVKIIRVESIPYKEYITLYDEAHILLDQVYAYDQGYNALEAMAAGKVVFTGAEKEFLVHYHLSEDEVCINALPDSNAIAQKLIQLIDNPTKIIEIGKSARKFVEREHHYLKIAEKYIEIYESSRPL